MSQEKKSRDYYGELDADPERDETNPQSKKGTSITLGALGLMTGVVLVVVFIGTLFFKMFIDVVSLFLK